MSRFTTARLLAAGTALALTATPAFAQDEMKSNYSGFYIAGSVGAAIQKNDNNDVVVFDTNLDGTYGDTVFPVGATTGNAFSPGFCNGFGQGTRPPGGTLAGSAPCSDDSDDQEYAVKIGLDGQLGSHLVAGVLVEGSTTNAKDSTSAFSTTPARYTFTRGIDYAISARGRFGYTPDGSGLFYVTGGPSYAKLDHRFNTTNTVNTFTQQGGNKVWGYQVGGGAEIAVASGLGLGLEYLYSKYDDEDYFVAIGPSTPVQNAFRAGTNFRPSEQDFSYHSVRANLIYKF